MNVRTLDRRGFLRSATGLLTGLLAAGSPLAVLAPSRAWALDLTAGSPVAHVHVDEHENDRAMRRHAQEQGAKMYEAVGARRVIKSVTPPATHNMCTARMSSDPRDGVTNAWGQTHDIGNLFVSDGSAFSSPGSANPTLTIVALASRQSNYIIRQMAAKNI